MLKLLIPNKKIILTQSIVYLNILVFITMVIMGVHPLQPILQDLISWGGNSMEKTLQGQPWRLLTSVFVHGGLFHLAVNMFSLLMMGVFIEVSLGKIRYLVVYLFCGVLASVTSLAFNKSTIVGVSIGASGAIFGLVGFLLLLLLSKRILLPNGDNSGAIKQIFIVIAINLAIGFSVPAIDNAAHIGGLVAGLFAALLFIPQALNKTRANIIILILISIFAILFINKMVPNQKQAYDSYQKIIEKFNANKINVLSPTRLLTINSNRFDKKAKLTILQLIDNNCIKVWQQKIAFLNRNSSVPSIAKSHYEKIQKMSELKLQQCQFAKSYVQGFNLTDKKKIKLLESKIARLFPQN